MDLDRSMLDVRPMDDTFNIFLNNVDSFRGKYILSYLNKQGYEVAWRDNQEIRKFDFDFNSEEAVPEENNQTDKSGLTGRVSDENKEKLNVDFRENVNTKPTVSQMSSLNSKYKIFGTITDMKNFKEDDQYELVGETYDQFKKVIRMCGCIIYDISLDESQIPKALAALGLIERELERKAETSAKVLPHVTFILISTAMTWAFTPSMDPFDLDLIPYNESDYRRRKCHPNYKEHYACEKEVLQKGRKLKHKLRAFVVCTGITYGFEENMLSFLFKRAWNNDDYLPVFGKGANIVPLIHVADLARVICKIVDTPCLKNQYILAVEQTPTPLRFIVKYISRTMGSGKIEYVDLEEAFLYPEVDQIIFDHLTANILMEPNFITEKLKMEWKSEMNLVENIEEIVEEFKTQRNLQPMKIFVQGAPCTGKSTLSLLLSQHYNLNYISITKILGEYDDYMNYSKQSTTPKQKPQTPQQGYLNMETLKGDPDAEELLGLIVEDSEEENYQKSATETRKKLLSDSLGSTTSERMSDEKVVRLIKNEMLLNTSQNQGFVLDGFPRAFKQLFKSERPKSSEDNVDKPNSMNKNYQPGYVIVLDAPDDFLLNRISTTPEQVVQSTHYDDRDVIRRLMFYREHTSVEWNAATYFKDCQTDVIKIDVSEFPSQNMDCIFYICTKILGSPRGFGLSPKENEVLEITKKYTEKLKEEREKLEKELQERKNKEELAAKMEITLKLYHEENIRTERKLAPIIDKYRHFIATKILPHLTEAVIILAEVKPDDPVDFLAEYLFKNNPNGKMYNPRYTRNGEMLINENIH